VEFLETSNIVFLLLYKNLNILFSGVRNIFLKIKAPSFLKANILA
jgi:hypothetical protein